MSLQLGDPERSLVVQILSAHLPPGAIVHVVGSRARGTARRYSDLDLALDAHRKLTADERAALAEAFADSLLPWKVDLIDTNAIDPAFGCAIASDWVALSLDGMMIEEAPPGP